MAKLTEIIVVNSHTLRLETDAKKGDEIDLRSLSHIDMSILSQKIDEKLDAEYEKRLRRLEQAMRLEKENEIQKATKEIEQKVVELNQQLRLQETNLKNQLEASFKLDKQELMNKINEITKEKETITRNKQNEIELAVSQKVNETQREINLQKQLIQKLESDKANLLMKSEFEIKEAVSNKEKELLDTIRQKEDAISKLSLEKTMLNIKKMGEELETWVDEEYQNHALNGFETSTWDKDNESVKAHGESRGTKADYIFKVYATEERLENDLLTSVACEIKSEAPGSTHKTKNADHYEKLHKDRIKKNCEYALLISELEWDSTNDAPIRKVQGYDKMYMVRPQYFIVFLNIVTALALKYKDILVGHNVQREKFKDSEDILEEFSIMKEEILGRSINYIQNKMEEITKSAEGIKKEANKIIDASDIVLRTHIQTVINKIQQFRINQIIDKINEIDPQ